MVHPTHEVVPSGLFVSKGNKLDFLQLPVLHALSISHDMPNGSVPRQVTGEGDLLQGTSALPSFHPLDFPFRIPPI